MRLNLVRRSIFHVENKLPDLAKGVWINAKFLSQKNLLDGCSSVEDVVLRNTFLSGDLQYLVFLPNKFVCMGNYITKVFVRRKPIAKAFAAFGLVELFEGVLYNFAIKRLVLCLIIPVDKAQRTHSGTSSDTIKEIHANLRPVEFVFLVKSKG